MRKLSRPDTNPGNGEDTGKQNLHQLVSEKPGELAQPSDGSDPFTQIAIKILHEMEKSGGGSGGGDEGDGGKWIRHFKPKILATIIIALLGSGATVVGAVKLMDARSINNEKRLDAHEASTMHPGSEKRFIAVEQDIQSTKETVTKVYDTQKIAIEGIEQLKKEAQTERQKRLEEKVQELERENRRLERRTR